MTICVLVADNSRARIFSAASATAKLKETNSFVHAESRLHARDLTSDLPGRSFDGSGRSRHAMQQRIDPKEDQTLQFAEQLVAFLEEGRVNHRFDKLYVAAPPELLGLLRDRYGKLAPMLAAEIDKHLTQCTPDELRKHLPERL